MTLGTPDDTSPKSSAPAADGKGYRPSPRWHVARQRVRKVQEITWVTLLVILLTILAFALGVHFEGQVRTDVHWKYWLEIATANWAPDQPTSVPGSNSSYIGNIEYISGTITALLINLGPFVLIIGALRGVWKLERRKNMDTKAAYLLRDIDLENELYRYIKKIDPNLTNSAEKRQNIRNGIKDVFDKARVNFVDTVKTAYGEEGARYVETHPDEFVLQ